GGEGAIPRVIFIHAAAHMGQSPLCLVVFRITQSLAFSFLRTDNWSPKIMRLIRLASPQTRHRFMSGCARVQLLFRGRFLGGKSPACSCGLAPSPRRSCSAFTVTFRQPTESPSHEHGNTP